MKKKLVRFTTILGTALILHSCCGLTDHSEDINSDLRSRSNYIPIMIERSELESSIKIENPKQLKNSGKIYIKGSLLFIGEKRKGFHVFDNSNKENPIPISFLSIPGSTDLAIRNDILYVNQARDLVTLQLNSISKELHIIKRINNTFPPIASPDGFENRDEQDDLITINWIEKTY